MRRTSGMGLSFPPFTRAVKQLLIANGVIFLLFALFQAFDATRPSQDGLTTILGSKAMRSFTARSGS